VTGIRPVLFLDIDRVLSPIHDTSTWSDYTTIASPYGDVPVSPRLLGVVGALPADIVYVTDWGDDAHIFDRFLGRDDTTVAARIERDHWWKTAAVAAYLSAHPGTRAFIHVDDHLDDDRIADLHRIAAGRPHQPVVPEDGLTEANLDQMRAFLDSV